MPLPELVSGQCFEPHIGRSVSIDHAARLLGVSRRTVYNRISEGRLRTVRTLGGSQRVLLESARAMGGRLPDTPAQKIGSNLLLTAAIALTVMAGGARPAAAEEQRARVSADLADRLASDGQDVVMSFSRYQFT